MTCLKSFVGNLRKIFLFLMFKEISFFYFASFFSLQSDTLSDTLSSQRQVKKMVKKTNTRIIITVSKKQNEWLHSTAKKMNMSVSKLCKWLMDKNIAKLASFITEEEWKELVKIAKIPWIKLDSEDD